VHHNTIDLQVGRSINLTKKVRACLCFHGGSNRCRPARTRNLE